ncbi:MAG: AAA family ATPase [Caldilineaceae bacterium]
MPQPIQATTYTFRKIIEGGFLYVDKTCYLYELVRLSSGTYFISRPRRFGKSLMISTLEEIFLGNKELFQGLWIYASDYAWESYPVIHIDFGIQNVTTADETKRAIEVTANRIAADYGLAIEGYDYQSLFVDLTRKLADAQHGKVVLLVDEYDRPIVNNLSNLEEAKAIRDVLRALYGVVKALDRYWRFVFITGISKFSRVGVFSTMNNLDDLTMDYRLANALGITEEELTHYFKEYIDAFAAKRNVTSQVLLEHIRRWYDGFRFAAEGQNLYNPYSTIQLFQKQRFANYWFASGTPGFLIKLLQENEYDIATLAQVEVDEIAFNTYELDNLAIIPLLFQTGYLTIKDFMEDDLGEVYTLSYPNYEVEHAFITYLLNAYNGGDITLTDAHLRRLIHALRAHELEQFFTTLNIFFANIDYDLHLENEKHYRSIFYMIFLLLGLNIAAEMKTSSGRIDAVIELQDRIFIFEFKLNSAASTALQQTKDKAYAERYRSHHKPITLVGANYLYKERKISERSSEEDQP